ncbi:MAG: tRNA (guanosine(37)-N1)-methyltransferase TrmD [Gammaproteobacteria bacterium]|nr:tRNA (guanosine(37)-N1)-methyltransferase TrmD [Gammaproteobacteria bacterium]MBT5406936.1 tRNA (guanosine(37)-N1)-methyltransferase TrmD [Gammaproteobacteria bacterium]MBT5643756.1 tRNA (guanosine(37)-N1)-methyltransferase TrmD [Gammaproteobacteria bacterium]MBT5863125.1 tRNA (guanosine(37)-N1)-methyltransferase TrmD [Gammaproteobacteria bacterium]MBT6733818.1 tRNA (guanosine(37)-N1)-methyltransferase TrmD [Gammaproteobacteria bacterium]|tara:strand:+ start:495 stop:1235 length:741 start_codon:yes stop_codon:yes gene_type:complete
MIFNILTIFPELISTFSDVGFIKRAISKNVIDINIVNIREYSDNIHNRVDDKTYGGGPGMVLQYLPIKSAMDSLQKKGHVIYLSPQGKILTQEKMNTLSSIEEITFLCGRYEGVDQRVLDELIDEEISLGDYVISGGETACMAIIEGVTRLTPGAIDDIESVNQDSFQNGILDHPHYTRPDDIGGRKVPEVLSSGDHASIERWRKKQALGATWIKRPELLKNVKLSKEDDKLLKEYIAEFKDNEHK